MSYTNNDPFAPWNTFDKDNPFKPWNGYDKDNPFTHWNNPYKNIFTDNSLVVIDLMNKTYYIKWFKEE